MSSKRTLYFDIESRNFEDWSTRKVRRKYIKFLKTAWREQQYGFKADANREYRSAKTLLKELERRGWAERG